MKIYRRTTLVLAKALPIAALFLFQSPMQATSAKSATTLQQTINNPIKGNVLDEKNRPVAGAKVSNPQNSAETVTDQNGNFEIEAQPGDVLSISFENYQTGSVAVSGNSVSVHLVKGERTKDIQEVTLVGYGSRDKSGLTGAISQVKASEFRKGNNVSADNLLQGKVAGVRIVQSSGEPGAGVNVSIRGIGSIRSGSTPLFVVDGVPLSNESVSSAGPNFGLGNSIAKNPLNFLNTNDIESMTVLKDAAAAAIYGARGSNGVVLITTKSGKGGAGQFVYDTSLGFSSVIKKLDVLSADEYRAAITDKAYDHGGNTDWQDAILRRAMTQNHAVSFSKATNSGNYFASVSHMDQQGIILNSKILRTSARVNAEESFLDDKRLKVKVNLTASEIKDTGVPNGYNGGSDGQLIIHALMANPTRSIFDDNGAYTNFNMNAHYNPRYLLSIYDDHTNTLRVLGNVEATLRIVNGLNYKFNYGVDRSTSERNTTIYPNVTDRTPKGAYVQSDLKSLTTLIEHYLTYDKTFGLHTLNLLAGFSYQKFQFSGTFFGLTNIADQGTGVMPEYNPNYSGTPVIPSPGYAQENELQSYFGRVNYSFAKKYLLSASVRADGSTRFGANNKYGYFPAFSAGWVISEENFLKDSPVIQELKLRGSWGQTGNQEVPNKITQASYSLSPSSGYYLFGDLALVNGIAINRTANADLKWEVVTQSNFGIDFSTFKRKLYGTLEYFSKVTSDPILNIPSEPLSPTTTVWKNVSAKIENKGFEASLGSQIFSTENFQWNVDFNGATLRNKVKDLPVSEIYSGEVSGPGLSGVAANIYKNGYSIGSFYMLKYLGVDANGKYIYEDISGNGTIGNEDRQIFESALPKVTYGINSYLRYKKFDLTIAMLGQAGGYLVNNTALDLNINNLASDRNVLRKYYESGASSTNAPQLSSLYLEKSDFLRLNNLQLGYNFDIDQLKWIKSLYLFVSSQNLFTITPYSGYDPLVDTNKNVSGNQSLGIDYTTYPSAKTYMLGATIKF